MGPGNQMNGNYELLHLRRGKLLRTEIALWTDLGCYAGRALTWTASAAVYDLHRPTENLSSPVSSNHKEIHELTRCESSVEASCCIEIQIEFRLRMKPNKGTDIGNGPPIAMRFLHVSYKRLVCPCRVYAGPDHPWMKEFHESVVLVHDIV